MSSPKTAETSPSPAPSSVGGNNGPKFGTVIPNRVFVGGISSSTTEQDLMDLFSQYGTVKATKIISDRAGNSKGYGFVTFETEDEATRLTQEADNIMLKDRKLNIAPAVKKQITTEYPGFMKAYSPRLVDGVGGAGGVVSNQPAVFFNPAHLAYYSHHHQQQQQHIAALAAAAAGNTPAVSPEYHQAAAAHVTSPYLQHTAALHSQSQAAAVIAAATNGGGCSTPTQPQYVQASTVPPAAPHSFVYPSVYYPPHYQLHNPAAQQQQVYGQQVAVAGQTVAAGWPASLGPAAAGQWRWLNPQQAYAANPTSPQQGSGSVGFIAGEGLYAATQQSAPYILPDASY